MPPPDAVHPIRLRISRELEALADPDKAEWWDSYLKGVIPFLGVGIPRIRALLKKVAREEHWEEMDTEHRFRVLDGLMATERAEEKLGAILMVQLFERPLTGDHLQLISRWFDKQWIYDWNTCDWLCVRLLTPMVDKQAGVIIPELGSWNRSAYLWKARASLVALAQAKTLTDHRERVLEFSDTLIRRPERFAKTAVGWVLREYSKRDPELVTDFLTTYEAHISAEVRRNATKYLS